MGVFRKRETELEISAADTFINPAFTAVCRASVSRRFPEICRFPYGFYFQLIIFPAVHADAEQEIAVVDFL